MIFRRVLSALLAFTLATSGLAQAQVFRPGYGFSRPGFQFQPTTSVGAVTQCANGTGLTFDFVANTGCVLGANAANSTSLLTTVRSTTGYDLAATTLFPANTARRTGAGLLVEAASTNSIFPNKPPNTIVGFASGTWGKDGTTGWTPNTTVAPDGTQTAGTAAFAASANNSFGYLLPSQALSGATAWFLLKGPAGSQIYFDFDAAAAPYARTLWTFTGGWDRVPVANVTQAASQKYVFLGTSDRVNGTTNLPAVNVAVAALQVELSSPVPTSLIPTTTAATTRAADQISFTIPTGINSLTYTFDDGSQQRVAVAAGSYTIPTNLNRPQIVRITSPPACIASQALVLDFVGDASCVNGASAGSSTAPLTTVRSTTGYDLAATTQFATNTARRTSAGLLVEPAATNLIVQSQTISTAPWVSRGSITLTAGQTAPDGSSTAFLISNLGAAGSGGANVYQQASTVTGSIAPGFWIKRVSTSGTVAFQNPSGAAGGDWSLNLALVPDGWQRITSKHPAITVTTAFSGSGANSAGAYFWTSTAPISAYWWGQQLEVGSNSTSYIPTTTSSATRAADQISFNVPSGVSSLTYTFDDGSQQQVSVTAGSYTIPTNLNRPQILAIQSTGTCQGGSLANFDFVANTGCVGGAQSASSVSNVNTSRASIGYDLAATMQFAANTNRRTGAGLLVEPASTNLLLNSGSGSSASNATQLITTTTGPTGPRGVATAKLAASASAGTHYSQQGPFTVASGATLTQSRLVKADGLSFVVLSIYDTAHHYTYFNLSTGAVATNAAGNTAVIRSVGGGFYVISITRTITGTSAYATMQLAQSDNQGGAGDPSFTGDGTSGVDLDYLQLEAASGPSSFIPTTTAAATRAADNTTLTIPYGADTLIYTFDDGSQQYVTVSPGSYTVPTNLRRPLITNIQITTLLAFYDFQNDTARSAGSALASSTSGLTVSRASIGYDLAATTQFAANVARRTGAGLLVEAAATNLLTNSQDIGGTGYAADSATVTRNSGTAPDGSTNSALVAFTAATTSQVHPTVSGTAGVQYVFSAFQKGASGGEVNNIFVQDNGGAYTGRGAAKSTLTTSWSRSFVAYSLGTNGAIPQAGTNSAVTGATAPTTARSVYTTFWQVETGSVATSYIPSVGTSATRAADNITLTLPTGVTKIDLVYSTGTTTVTVSPGTYTLPPNPANSNLLGLKAYAG